VESTHSSNGHAEKAAIPPDALYASSEKYHSVQRHHAAAAAHYHLQGEFSDSKVRRVKPESYV